MERPWTVNSGHKQRQALTRLTWATDRFCAMLDSVQIDFLSLLVRREALRFGSFTLKSGRTSPYYINTGCFHRASDLSALGKAYAHVIKQQLHADIDIVFGPAYKGIPLALAAAQGLAADHDLDAAWAYDRKETKDHGDGGDFVGAPLEPGKKVVIVDDVMTAGTALRESIAKLKPLNVNIVGAIISIDRMEAGKSNKRASLEITEDYGVPVFSIMTIREAVDYLAENEIDGKQYLTATQADEIRQMAQA